MCVWCSLDPRITTGSSCFFKYDATQLRMEKTLERAPVWTWPRCFVFFSSLSVTHLALHMSSGWRLTAFAGLSRKLQWGCLCGFLKAVVIVPEQLCPAHRSFHLESWADLYGALWMNHLLPAWVEEGLTVVNLRWTPRWVITLGGWSLSMGCGERWWVRLQC